MQRAKLCYDCGGQTNGPRRCMKCSREKDWRAAGINGASYGLYEIMQDQQAGRCMLWMLGQFGEEGACSDFRELTMDHCHRTGKIRGLLCSKHNAMLGQLGDCRDGAALVLEYLANFEEDNPISCPIVWEPSEVYETSSCS
jgi:hypothetical protein